MGHTPMIKLNRMNKKGNADVYVKFEGLNVGGSIKTRTAYNMIRHAEKEGKIHEGTIIVEPTSGNQGIGLALVGAVKGYKTIIIMPDSVSEERRKLVNHYGAEVILIHDDGDIGKCIQTCLDTALKMAEEDENVFVPQQFANVNNIGAHKYHTALEILEETAVKIDGFCSGIGTGGTITGIGEALKAQYPDMVIWAVEPENAAILAGGNSHVILCESGIRTFEQYTRNTFDIASIPVLKALTHLPVVADPCQGSGKYSLVPQLSRAACAAGADGLVIEVHPDPQHALCEGERQLLTGKFNARAGQLFSLHKIVQQGE